MLLENAPITPGDHAFSFEGAHGLLEAILTIPPQKNGEDIVILGHPHSLQGGTMSNKVITTLARACKDLGLISIRFNFRGVGRSAGVYDEGIGESMDMVQLSKLCLERWPASRFIFAGFSFGSYVAYRAACISQNTRLLTVAPPVHHFCFTEFNFQPASWMIFQGRTDEVVSAAEVTQFAQYATPALPIVWFDNTGHFFHGQLLVLREQMVRWLKSVKIS
ncbi:MAG: hypothetical protein CMF38_05250 [Legionellaceae bacterium]|nr:hypothetical protein [Legionellaceae bacterium]HCA90122.1 hypothetical protein [Legionellales bacterium]|tara:strand:+ start:6509 stop:7168 length:660 start_codon:yes stop_codon:yes gene_type:complete